MNRLLIALLLLVPAALFAESNGAPEAAPSPVTAPAAGDSSHPSSNATSTAHAPEQQPSGSSPQKAPPSQDPFGGMPIFLFLAVGLALMWFMASRSQKKEQRRQDELRSGIKRGDLVVTIGGAHAEVASVGESTVDLRLGKGDDAAVVTFNKSAIATVAGADVGKAK